MRSKCAMYGCKSATYNKYGYLLNFHRFPRDPEREKVWKELCNNPRIYSKTYKYLWLCSLHFEKSCYIKDQLKADAVPTLNLSHTAAGLFSAVKKPAVYKVNTVEAKTNLFKDANLHRSNDCDAEDEEQRPEVVQIDDDCESASFSSDEEEEKDEVDDLDRDSPQPSGSGVVKEEYERLESVTDYIKPIIPTTKPVEPVYQSLPKISRASKFAESNTARPSTSKVGAVIIKCEDRSEETELDDCSTFAAHVQTRMRKFEHAQKIIAQKLISDIMFMADTLQLNLTSAVVNPQTQAVQYVQAVHGAHLAQPNQLTHVQFAQVPQAVNNGFIAAAENSFAVHDIESENEDEPLPKRPNQRTK